MTTIYLGRSLMPYHGFGEVIGVASQSELESSEYGVHSLGYALQDGHYLWSSEQLLRKPDIGDRLFANRHSRHRPEDVDRTIHEAEFSVIVVGSSFAQGWGASSPDVTWSAVLERLLAQRLGTTKVACLTATLAGAVSTQDLVSYVFTALPRRPSAIIVVNGHNDFAMPLWYGCRPGDPYLMSSVWKCWFGHQIDFSATGDGALLESIQSHISTILDDERRRENLLESIAAIYEHNTRRMLELAQLEKVPTVVWCQPWKARSIALTDESDPGTGFGPKFGSAVLDAHRRIVSRLSGVPFFTDLSTRHYAISSFTDPYHLDDDGQRVFAEYALEQLDQDGMIAKRSTVSATTVYG